MNNKTVNVDFVARAIEIELDGKEHFIAAALAAEQAIKAKEESAASVALIKTRKALWYENVAAMKADKSINAGSYVNTAGYYKANDGGGGSYIIRAKTIGDVEDGGSIHFLQKELVAELIVENGTVRPEQFGAKGDGVTDDTKAIQAAIDIGSMVTLGKTTYNISNTININKPISITSDNSVIAQLVFAHDKGCFKICCANVNFYGRISLKLNTAKGVLGGKEGCVAITFYAVDLTKLHDYYFDDIAIYNFVGGYMNASPKTDNIYINRLYVENVDFGIWGANFFHTHINTIVFKDVDHSQANQDPAHVIYLTGNDVELKTFNFVVDNIVGTGCKKYEGDSVISIKDTENFICHNLNVKDVNHIFYAFCSSGLIENIVADRVHSYAFGFQQEAPNKKHLLVQNGDISNLIGGNKGFYRVGANANAIVKNIKFSGMADFGLYLSDVRKFEEYNCEYINKGLTSIPAYKIATNTEAVVYEPKLEKCSLAQYAFGGDKVIFYLNPAKYNSDEANVAGYNHNIVPNNILVETADANNMWVANNLKCTGATITQLRSNGDYMLINGGVSIIPDDGKLILKDGSKQVLASDWKVKKFKVFNGVGYEV